MRTKIPIDWKKEKIEHYSLDKILSKNALYNIIFGERSNGKTYAVLKYGIENYIKSGEQMAIVRRWQEDLIGKRGTILFANIVSNGLIKKLTNGTWTDVYYYASKWYLCKYNSANKRVVDDKPFAYGFSIASMEHDKSGSYPDITTIFFDEFLTRSMYLNDEFVLFMNLISTIVRHRTNVKIFLVGNTVNKYCPYFNEFGLDNIKNMKKGDIDIYKYENSDLLVAVEYCGTKNNGKPSDVYFAFNNPKLTMITGGAWEAERYPHCPVKIKPKDIAFSYFIIFNDECLQCDIVFQNEITFTFVHRKTTEIKNIDNSLIYSPDFNPKPNFKRRLTRPTSELELKIVDYFKKEKVFYSDNEVGEIMRNYLIWSGKNK